MKRFVIVLVAVLSAFSASAQVGIVGGITSASRKIKNVDVRNTSRYHFGMAYKQRLGLGFVFQPEMLYNVKGSECSEFPDYDTSTSYLEAGAQIQWGLNLPAFRPYVLAEPFLGYALNASAAGTKVTDWTGLNRFEYGIGFGFGAELIGHVQISAKFFWNLDSLYNEDRLERTGAVKHAGGGMTGGNVSGTAISAALFF